MANVEQVANIEELIPLDGTKKIISHKIARLTAPGDNYGSVMLRVDITVETPYGKEQIYAAAKTVPSNEVVQEIFNTSVTFRNEIAFYKQIVPLLRDFQRKHSITKVIDFFPEYYGSRLNLSRGDKVDQDAVLVLENLKVGNYCNLDPLEGLDLDAAELIITDLAHLHAVPLALKLEKPEVFENEIKPYLSPWLQKEKHHNVFKAQLIQIIDQIEELVPLKERIVRAFEKQIVLTEAREPFATITHNDCWMNNNMIKLEGTKPVKNKMVDFQVCSYGSPARDVLFFLFTTVKSHVLKENYDNLVKVYYQTFISLIEELECDTKRFSFESLQKELDYEAATSQFGHIIFMLSPILFDKAKMSDISAFAIQDLVKDKPSSLHKEKVTFVVKEFVKRNWI